MGERDYRRGNVREGNHCRGGYVLSHPVRMEGSSHRKGPQSPRFYARGRTGMAGTEAESLIRRILLKRGVLVSLLVFQVRGERGTIIKREKNPTYKTEAN